MAGAAPVARPQCFQLGLQSQYRGRVGDLTRKSFGVGEVALSERC